MTEKEHNGVGEKIRQAIKEAGLTQQKLADKLGITNPVVNVWVQGKRNPTTSSLKKIAEATGKPFSFFISEKDSLPNSKEYSEGAEVMLIPIVGTSSASEGKFILEEIETYLPIKKSAKKQFAVRVEGDCMTDPDDPANSIYNGSYIIVDPDTDAISGDVVLARIGGEYSTIKRYFPKEKEIKLQPDNPKYSTLILPKPDVEIIGKVVNIYRPSKRKKERE